MFTTKNTTRFKDDHFQVIDEKGNPLHKLRPSEKSKAMIPNDARSKKCQTQIYLQSKEIQSRFM